MPLIASNGVGELGPEWTPRFLAYAEHLGMSPEGAIIRDRDRYPGGSMTGFVLWLQGRWRAWHKARGIPDRPSDYAAVRGSRWAQDDFDRFLGAPAPVDPGTVTDAGGW